jgi:uncharacterized damage-inducible protein DinB
VAKIPFLQQKLANAKVGSDVRVVRSLAAASVVEYRSMDAIAHYTRLFAYDAWANQEVLANLRGAQTPPPRALKYLAHILAAERLWLERLEQREEKPLVWPEFTLDRCQEQTAELARLWNNYLAAHGEADLAQPIRYKNSKGKSWSSRKDDVLMHVIMHSAYHRGQIAADVRAAGLTPAYTDFILSVRQRFIR